MRLRPRPVLLRALRLGRVARWAVFGALAAAALAPASVRAEAPAQEADAERADADGPQLRVSLGPSYLAGLQSLDSGQEASVEGFALGFGFALAAPLSRELALGLDLALVRAGAAEHGVLSSTVFTALHLGAGVTFWLSPARTFLAGSIGLARSSVEGDRLRLGVELPDNDPSDVGLGLLLAFGHQLRITERFGLGGSLSLLTSFANNPIGGEDGLRTVLALTLALTATLH